MIPSATDRRHDLLPGNSGVYAYDADVSRPLGRGRPRASVEDHEYEAIIEGANTGRHMLRVNHVWLLSPSLGEILVMPAYEGAIVVTPRRP